MSQHKTLIMMLTYGCMPV